MNWLKSMLLPLVKSLILKNVDRLDSLEPKFSAILVAKLTLSQENADAVAKSLVDAAQAEIKEWIEKI